MTGAWRCGMVSRRGIKTGSGGLVCAVTPGANPCKAAGALDVALVARLRPTRTCAERCGSTASAAAEQGGELVCFRRRHVGDERDGECQGHWGDPPAAALFPTE